MHRPHCSALWPLSRVRTRVLFSSALMVLLAGSVPAQAVDLVAAEQELATMFDRTAGTPIADTQKQKLADFLRRYEGQDLGRLSYARALDFYFRRDAVGGAAVLDEFFARHDQIAQPEHATMAGRIYLVAMREESRKTDLDVAKLHRWAERTAAMFPDLSTVARQATMLASGLADAPAFRQALVRGMLRSSADDAAKDRFLTLLYTPLIDGGVSAAGSGRDVVATAPTISPLGAGAAQSPGTAPAAQKAAPEASATIRVGDLLPELPVENVLQAKPEFRLTDLRGKVVVIDFFATWCPPCRTGIPELQKLGQKAGDQLQIVGVTRFYGRGMDFADDAKVPHGGKSVTGLARADEVTVNSTFAKAFAINYPIVFTTEKAMKDTFGVGAIPTTIIVGKDGRVVGRVLGSGEAELRKLAEIVAQAMR